MTTIIRNTALTIAGAAITAGAIAAPTTALANPTTITTDRKPNSERHLTIRYEAQPNFYYCGPSAARNALTALDKNPSVDEAAKKMGTTEAGTNSAADITNYLNTETNGKYRTIEIPTPTADTTQTHKMRADIINAIDDGRAIVTNIAGTATDTDGATHSFEGGHYISVVAYRDNGDTVKIADSANPDHASYWITTEALADWTATRGYSA
ncbi:C39 family peptidase [Micromonospora sp. WMMD882]|uniref:C39 family peptidase n=1 Tax=Micromonospora sp. WMMD882 TaxID=3015151 RepID=UPI00248D3192|nr:C39 family peptidase [Micromonospora sp. WMMD882]WBB81217.1 C39 family peptidase [Micromonospora sp. WMMD882]